MGKSLSPETRAKISAALSGRPRSPEHRAKISAALRGRKAPPRSAEHRAKVAEILRKRNVSPEHRAKVSAANKGKPKSAESVAKMSAAKTGIPLSAAHREAIAAGNRIPVPDGTKWCYRCRSPQPIDQFTADRSRSDGLGPYCRACARRENAKRTFHLRTQVIGHYGGACSCCGEDTLQFLCIDHINGCSGELRREQGGGIRFYYWLKRHGYPDGYRVLCANCNQAVSRGRVCPHQT